MQNWILIADAASARIFATDPRSPNMQLVHKFSNPRGRARRAEIVSSKPGRVYKAVGTVRAAADPRTDPHDVEVERFARQLAQVLQEAFDQNAFRELAIVAAPRFLGVLRGVLHPQTQKHLRNWVAMNCSKIAAAELPERLKQALPEFFNQTR